MGPTGKPPVLERLVMATNAHDLDALVACFAGDYVLTMPAHPAQDFVGADQVRRNWAGFFHGIPDIQATITDHALRGDVAWTEWQMSGTRRDGTVHLMRGVAIFTVTDDLLSSCRFYVEPVDQSDRRP